ncbi:MAG TPA: mechanosensitive ion channel [Acidimicrobiales bacterium]|nr:mechanosensitive ion channel [Acidimicrobiales bacterium]
MNKWIWVAVAVVAGLVVGAVISAIVRRLLSRDNRPDILQRLSEPVAGLAFSLSVVAGLIVALGIVKPDSLDTLPTDVVDYLPRLLTGVIVLMVGSAAAGLASGAVGQALARSGATAQKTVPTVVRGSILVAAGILAADQLGIDTTIITLAVAAVLFSAGAGAAMMIGFGSREVAGQVAAARALRQMLSEGDTVTIEDRTGLVVAIHSTATELSLAGGERVLVPNSRFLNHDIFISRAGDERDEAP